MRKLVFLAALFAFVVAAPRIEAQPTWEDNFDTYATGSPIAGQGGWQTFDDNPAFDTIVTNVQSFNPPNSLLVSGAANVIRPVVGPPQGDLYVQFYVPATQTGEVWLGIPNTYIPGGKSNWSVRVVMCVSACTTPGAMPGQIVNIGGSEVPGVGSAPLVTDQWFVLWLTYDLPPGEGHHYAVGVNGILFTPFQPWSVTAPSAFEAVAVFSNKSTAAYMDDALLLEFVPVELMSITVD